MRRAWTEEELQKLDEMRFRYSINEIAEKLGRSHCSVEAKFRVLKKATYSNLTELYTVNQVAEMVGVHRDSILRMMRRGCIVPKKTCKSRPKHFFSMEQVDEIRSKMKKFVRLSDYDKSKIRSMYSIKGMSVSEIAREMNRSHSTIDSVIFPDRYRKRDYARRESLRQQSESKTIPEKSEAS